MGGLTRRLGLLEQVYAPTSSAENQRGTYRAWLRTRSDNELDLMATAAEHLQTGGDAADLGASVCDALARTLATWQVFQEAHG